MALANSVGPENSLRLQHLEHLPALVNAILGIKTGSETPLTSVTLVNLKGRTLPSQIGRPSLSSN